MTSTATDYLNRINADYPKVGVDNDTQGFRDNFKNIQSSLRELANETTALDLYAVRKDDPVSDFSDNILKQVVLQDSSHLVYEDTDIQTGDVTVNYANGSYQKFTVGMKAYNFSISNWPSTGNSGRVTISINTGSSTATAVVDFISPNVVDMTVEGLPITVKGEKLFEVWNDGATDKIYVKTINKERWSTLWNTTTATVQTYIGTPTGAIVFFTETSKKKPYFWNGSAWKDFTGGGI